MNKEIEYLKKEIERLKKDNECLIEDVHTLSKIDSYQRSLLTKLRYKIKELEKPTKLKLKDIRYLIKDLIVILKIGDTRILNCSSALDFYQNCYVESTIHFRNYKNQICVDITISEDGEEYE